MITELKLLKRIIGFCSLLLLLPSYAYAEDTQFPLVKNQPIDENLPKNAGLDIIGFHLLMNINEVEAKVPELLKQGYKVSHNDDVIRSLDDLKGNLVSYKYGRSQTMINKSHDFIILNYTSALLGSRIESIRRIVYYDDEVDISTVDSGLLDKFGNPTYQTSSTSQIDYKYFFDFGIQLENMDQDTYKNRKCWQSALNSPRNVYLPIYRFDPNRQNELQFCKSGIEVNVVYGASKKRSKEVNFFVWDHDLSFKNLKIQDEFLYEALLAKRKTDENLESAQLELGSRF
ncbi:MAG: hypothetical protein COB24_15110 [Hyphomicrobiales bacterium]|nr:MAG: hypothetical protein COB24_15110 [Hyphomicrobiales bacterium]